MNASCVQEQWLPVRGFEGAYEVSNTGRVRSLDRTIRTKHGLRFRAGRELKQDTGQAGHKIVDLASEQGRRRWYVHRLVLETFVGSPGPGQEGCHANGDPADNRLSNLRWDTHKENMRDVSRYGTHHNAKRTHCKRGHRLGAPNVAPSVAKAGKRSCLACSRARASARERGEPIDQALADWQYARITGEQSEALMRAIESEGVARD